MTYFSFFDRRNRSRLARVAGALYLVIILCGVWSEGIARAQLIVPGDAMATALAIAAAPGLLSLSVAADTVMACADVALAAVFLALLSTVQPLLALIAAFFRLVQAALIGAGLVALAGAPAMFSAGEAQGMALIGLHALAYDLGLVFFAVSCAAMAVLLAKAGTVPRPIYVGLALSALVYLTGSALRLFAPEQLAGFQTAYLIPLVSESALCLWLLVTGRI